MKKIYFIAGMVILLSSVTVFTSRLLHKKEILPRPYETLILDREEEHDLGGKLEWIEQMHRTAPGDNWRLMDQQYRFSRQAKRASDTLPIYGKWRELGSKNQAGRTVYVLYDQANNEMYVASDGGQIWKGYIGAENWHSITDHIKIPAIRFMDILDNSSGSRLLVHSSEWSATGIMFSDDDGQSWSMATGLENVSSWGFIKRTVIKKDEARTIYCVSKEFDTNLWMVVSRIYRSDDHGESF